MSESLLILPQHVVVRNVLSFEQHRIACRKVEYHYVVALDSAQSLEAVIRPFDAFGERFLVSKRHRMVYERKCHRGIGHLGTVGYLADVEIVPTSSDFSIDDEGITYI